MNEVPRYIFYFVGFVIALVGLFIFLSEIIKTYFKHKLFHNSVIQKMKEEEKHGAKCERKS